MYQKKERNKLQKISPHLSQLNVAMAHMFHTVIMDFTFFHILKAYVRIYQLANILD